MPLLMLVVMLAVAPPAARAQTHGFVPEVVLERLGEPRIEPANNYSENTRVRVRLRYPPGHWRAGDPLTGYRGAIHVEEWNSRIYDGLDGATALPSTIEAPAGVGEFTLKSLAHYAMFDQRNMPIPQIAVSVAGGEPALLQIPQWVDADGNDKTDWLEQRVEDILRRARASTEPEVAEAAAALERWEQSYRRDCGGFDERAPGAMMVSASCVDWDGSEAHRTNRRHELTATVLHELRHVWVYWQSRQDRGFRRLLKAPAFAPVPCVANCGGVIWVQDPRYRAEEADAEAFAERYKHLFP